MKISILTSTLGLFAALSPYAQAQLPDDATQCVLQACVIQVASVTACLTVTECSACVSDGAPTDLDGFNAFQACVDATDECDCPAIAELLTCAGTAVQACANDPGTGGGAAGDDGDDGFGVCNGDQLTDVGADIFIGIIEAGADDGYLSNCETEFLDFASCIACGAGVGDDCYGTDAPAECSDEEGDDGLTAPDCDDVDGAKDELEKVRRYIGFSF